MVKLVEPDEKVFNECVKEALESAYKWGYSIAEGFEEPVPEEELSVLFEHWHSTDWWANWVIPEFEDSAMDCLITALKMKPEEVDVREVYETYPEWVDETVRDLIEELERGFIDGLREWGLLIER